MDLLAFFDIEIDAITSLPSVAPNSDWQDFSEEFDLNAIDKYSCQDEHFKVGPLLFTSNTSFNPKTNQYVISGDIVLGCPVCGQSIHKID